MRLLNADLDRFLVERVHAHGRATQRDTSIQHSPRKFNFVLASKLISQPHAPPCRMPRRWMGHLATSLTATHAASHGFMRMDAPLSATLQFSTPLVNSISSWPASRSHSHTPHLTASLTAAHTVLRGFTHTDAPLGHTPVAIITCPPKLSPA